MSDKASNSETIEYRVLARKYRPSTFSELIGQETMVQTLSNAIGSGRLAHAFILTGVRGVGKTTTARLIAKALNCIGKDGKGDVTVDPCGVCENCLAIGESRHVDVIEMDAASRTGVDDVREIIDSVRYAPVSARFKIYIIDEVHMLSKNAFNALLKTLEEPPPHVKFLFATTEIRKLPVTVLSRCQRFDLRRVTADTMISHLKNISDKEGGSIDDMALAMIARAAEGSVRDGLSLLDQAIAHGGGVVSAEQVREMMGLADRSRVLDLFRSIMAGQTKEALTIFRDQYDLGADPAVIMKDLAETTHWITRLKVVPDAGTDTLTSEAERKDGQEMAESLGMPQLTRAWQMILKGIGEVQSAAYPVVVAEMVLIRLCYASELPSPADLIATLSHEKDSGAAAPKTEPNGSSSNEEASSVLPLAAKKNSPAPEQITAPTAQQGGQILALKPKEDLPSDLEPMPINYRALIDLFVKRRRPIISTMLYDNVRLVSYKPGLLSIYPTRDMPANFASDVRQCLDDWTGQDWQIVIVREGGEPTLREQDKDNLAQQIKEASSDPFVASILQTFKGAKIVKIKDINKED